MDWNADVIADDRAAADNSDVFAPSPTLSAIAALHASRRPGIGSRQLPQTDGKTREPTLTQPRIDEVQRLRDRLAAAEGMNRQHTKNLVSLRAAIDDRDVWIARMAATLDQTRQRLASAEDWLRALRASTSWRITRPLRSARRWAYRLVGRVPGPQRRAWADLPEVTVAQLPEPACVPARLHPPVSLRGPRRAVHQFHPGSASGDAVTNAMLLLRSVLRGQGYESEIYVEHIAPSLTEELRPWTELPDHDGYVLIVRVSLGYANFARIADLPAPKVLIYHSITPAELLGHDPMLQRFARLGREQLPLWSGRVAAALADSEVNAIDLRGAGFDNPLVCPLLFDVEEMRSKAGLKPDQNGQPFTILFVGRVVASKGQDALIDAFVAFAERFAAPCRLVLVGALPGPDDAYLVQLRKTIAASRSGAHILLTGKVPDADLALWYRRADLYVSLSLHEGFGVPLIEAIAHAVPVLAWPCAAVPYTLGDASEVLNSRKPPEVAAHMLALARDPELRTSIARRQLASLDRFRLDHHVPRLLQTLSLAGAALPPAPGTREALARHISFTVTGHINGSYSLASVNRSLALTIEAEMPGRVRVVPVEGQTTSDLSGVPDSERDTITRLVARGRPTTVPEIVISQHYPLLVPQDPCDCALALFFWEESLVPQATIRALNAGFPAVLAPSRFVAKALVDSGLHRPIHVIGQAPRLETFHALRPARARREPGRPFTFLHVSSGFPRKGVDVLLKAFARAFRRSDPVRLVIKCFDNPHNDVPAQLEALRAADPGLAEIELINRDLDPPAMLDLFRDADAMVLPTRGEGFNLPAAEAMASGLPLIVTGHGGHMDFCDDTTARLIDFRLAPSASHLTTAASLWAEPSQDDLVAALREIATRDPAARERIRQRAEAAAARVRLDLSAGALVSRLRESALDLVSQPPPAPVRVAWVSTWDVPCGIATYSRDLLSHLSAGRLQGLTVITDARTSTRNVALPYGLAAKVCPGWRLGDLSAERMLAPALATADPDVVMIQHQPGLIDWSSLARLITLRQLAGRAICLTLHNTSGLNDESTPTAAITSALAKCARLLVHTVADLDRLKSLGLVDNATLLPQGASFAGLPDVRPPRELQPSDDCRIGCFGFFLPGKGIAELIAAVALLRADWPGLRVRLVNAEYGSESSRDEIAACHEAAASLGIGDAIEWHTEYQDLDESRALLRDCDLLVLPYQASGEASSSAVRFALTSGVAVAVTPLPLFDDTRDAVVRLPGARPSEIAAGVRALLLDAAQRREVESAARTWLADHAWETIAERVEGMLIGLGQNAQSRRKDRAMR